MGWNAWLWDGGWTGKRLLKLFDEVTDGFMHSL